MSILRSVLIPAVLAAAVIVPVAVFAQQAQAPAAAATPQGQRQGHSHHRGGMMRGLRELNLTDQQKTQIHQIVQQFRQSHPQGERPDAQARQQLRDQIMNVLTPQQRSQYQANLQKMRAERRQREHPEPQSTP